MDPAPCRASTPGSDIRHLTQSWRDGARDSELGHIGPCRARGVSPNNCPVTALPYYTLVCSAQGCKAKHCPITALHHYTLACGSRGCNANTLPDYSLALRNPGQHTSSCSLQPYATTPLSAILKAARATQSQNTALYYYTLVCRARGVRPNRLP